MIKRGKVKGRKDKKWSLHALDINLWDKYNAPIIKVSNYSSINLNKLKDKGILTDKVIEICSSILMTPEIHCYVITKCDLINLSLTDIHLLQKYHYLQYIDLSHNNLTDLSSLNGIPYLLYLNVSHNKLKDISNFAPPRYLTYLNLSHNSITSIKSLENFWSIVNLDLSYNFIEKIPRLHNLRYLKNLNLSHNFIEYVQHLEHLNVQELNLNFNRVKKFIFIDLDKKNGVFMNLRTLLLCHNQISSLKFLRDVRGIRIVDLRDNEIEDLMEVFNLNCIIYEIDLRNNPCTKWPSYKEIILFSMPSAISVDGIEVTESEMVSAAITFNPPINLLASRGTTQLTLLEQLNAPKINSIISYDEKSPPLIILSGPLAVKKLAIGQKISLNNSDKIKYCRSHTTRKNITHDIENNGFYFVNHEEFHEMARNGEFLTIEEILGDSYGLHVNELIELKKQKKIGITQLDFLATIQLKMRYPQVKLILVLTKHEDIHRQWIEDKLCIFRWIKNSTENLWALSIHTTQSMNDIDPVLKKINVVTDIINNVVNRVGIPSSCSSETQFSNLNNEIILPKVTMLYKLSKNKKYIKIMSSQSFIKNLRQDTFVDSKDSDSTLNVESEEIINDMNDYENAQKKISKVEIQKNDETGDILLHKSFQKYKNINKLKIEYVESILKSRQIYVNQHLNNPGFYSLVVYSDNFDATIETLKHFINDLYKNFSSEKLPKIPEIDYLKKFTFPYAIDNIIDELKMENKFINHN